MVNDNLDCSKVKPRHVGLGMECAVARSDVVSWCVRRVIIFLLFSSSEQKITILNLVIVIAYIRLMILI